jgi:hypothetical protein
LVSETASVRLARTTTGEDGDDDGTRGGVDDDNDGDNDVTATTTTTTMARAVPATTEWPDRRCAWAFAAAAAADSADSARQPAPLALTGAHAGGRAERP